MEQLLSNKIVYHIIVIILAALAHLFPVIYQYYSSQREKFQNGLMNG